MTYKLESALADLAEAIKTLKADTAGEAVDTVSDDPEAIAAVVKRCVSCELSGVGFEAKHPPLTVCLYDGDDSATEYATFDPIGDLISGWGDPAKDPAARSAFDRAYEALQNGIDRLRSYEAECRAKDAA